MSSRVLTGTLIALCAMGLAVAGVGWHGEAGPRPSSPKQVYCDINKLVRYHPAWDQYVQLHGLPSRPESSGDSVRTDVAGLGGSVSSTDALPVTDIEELQARLAARTDEELSKISGKLYCSLDRRVAERRAELVDRAEAEEADARRKAEESLAAELRCVDEASQCELVDATIKLSALRAQLAVTGAPDDRIKQSMAARSKKLADLQTKLARDEENVRKKTAANLAAGHADRLSMIDRDMSDLKSQESRRIDERIGQMGQRLRLDARVQGTGYRVQVSEAPVSDLRTMKSGVVSRAKAEYAAAVGSVGGANASFRDGLKDRMFAEMKAAVSRIARENGIQVTFTPTAGRNDSTDWFKSHLPYSTGRRSG